MKILFLDDNPHRHKRMKQNSIGFAVTFAWNAQEAIEAMEDGEFDLIMLDHDLDQDKQGLILDNEEDGRFVAKWMAENGRHKDAYVLIHSLNEPGRNSMQSILISAGFSKVVQLPYAWTMIKKEDDGTVGFDPDRPKSIEDHC